MAAGAPSPGLRPASPGGRGEWRMCSFLTGGDFPAQIRQPRVIRRGEPVTGCAASGEAAPAVGGAEQRVVAGGVGVVGDGEHAHEIANLRREPANFELPLGEVFPMAADPAVDPQCQ